MAPKTKQQLADDLLQRLGTGESAVRDGDVSSNFRPVDEIIKARQLLSLEIAAEGAQGPVSMSRGTAFDRE